MCRGSGCWAQVLKDIDKMLEMACTFFESCKMSGKPSQQFCMTVTASTPSHHFRPLQSFCKDPYWQPADGHKACLGHKGCKSGAATMASHNWGLHSDAIPFYTLSVLDKGCKWFGTAMPWEEKCEAHIPLHHAWIAAGHRQASD
jgi:hypothetical protein